MKNTGMTGIGSIQDRRDRRWRQVVGLVALGVALLSRQDARSQDQARRLVSRKITLTTKDGVLLSVVYFPVETEDAKQKKDKGQGGKPSKVSEKGKKTPVVMLVHDWESAGNEFYALARFFQQRKMAVVVPDLRGHGGSTRQIVGGMERTIEARRMNRRQMGTAVLDLEAVKKFLVEENNAGRLNVEMLVVGGAGFGGTLAITWAVMDWSAARLPGLKQGQDVKALLLLSPRLSYRGVTCRQQLRHPALRSRVAMLLIAGSDAPHFDEANRIYRAVYRPKHDDPTGRVVLLELDTKLEGARILPSPLGRRTAEVMADFINVHVTKQASRYVWQERKSPTAD